MIRHTVTAEGKNNQKIIINFILFYFCEGSAVTLDAM